MRFEKFHAPTPENKADGDKLELPPDMKAEAEKILGNLESLKQLADSADIGKKIADLPPEKKKKLNWNLLDMGWMMNSLMMGAAGGYLAAHELGNKAPTAGVVVGLAGIGASMSVSLMTAVWIKLTAEMRRQDWEMEQKEKGA